jgi:hypothetical protein
MLNTFLPANVLNYSHGIINNQFRALCVLWKIMQLAQKSLFSIEGIVPRCLSLNYYTTKSQLTLQRSPLTSSSPLTSALSTIVEKWAVFLQAQRVQPYLWHMQGGLLSAAEEELFWLSRWVTYHEADCVFIGSQSSFYLISLSNVWGSSLINHRMCHKDCLTCPNMLCE